MKTLTHALLITAALAGPAAVAELSASDRAALPARSASLEAQRAAGVSRAMFDAKDRASLDAAQASSPDLAQESSGLSDHDLTVIGITLLVVIAIIIIF